jgi:O-antigen ligase
MGLLTGLSAAVSLLFAAIRPDLALLRANGKGGPLGELLAGPYLHSNVLGIALTLGLPFVFAIAHRATRWCCLALTLAALLWTGSRTSELACLAVLVVAALLWRFPRRLWIASVAILGGLALIVALPLVTTDPNAFTRRGRIWTTLLGHFAERPILGHGADFFATQPGLGKELGGDFTHGHNIMVHLFVISGVLGFGLFMALFALVWRNCLALAEQGFRAGLIFLVGFVATSILEASHIAITLAGYQSWLPLLLLAGLTTVRPRPPEPDPVPEQVPQVSGVAT